MSERETLLPEEAALVERSRFEKYREMSRYSHIPLELPDAIGTLLNKPLMVDPDYNHVTVRTLAENALSMKFASYRDAEFTLSYALTMSRLRSLEQATVTGEELLTLQSAAEECTRSLFGLQVKYILAEDRSGIKRLNPFKPKSTSALMDAVELRVQQPDARTHISRLAQRGRGQR